MEEKISVTFKAGTGYDVPWVVLKAASIEEMKRDLAEVQSLFADVSYLAKSFDEAFKSAPKSARELVQNVLGGQHVNTEPVQPETAAPPAPAPSDTPWNNPPAASTPWIPQAAPPQTFTPPPSAPAPVGKPVYVIEVPREKSEIWSGPKGPDGKAVAGGGVRGQVIAELKNRGYDVYSKVPGVKPVDWDGTAKRNTIHRDVPEDLLGYIRSQGIELK